ncbi:hypothetical protein L204_102086 [Cryptococcus depauperatus]|nr:carboxypeptidase D [Cryptococcus depauperatus CBS 7855]
MWSVWVIYIALFILVTVDARRDLGGLRGQKPAALKAKKEAQRQAMAREVLEESRGMTERSNEKRFYNNKTSEFFVESLPDVHFDLGEVYSGLIPIDYSNKSEGLFFVFQPKLGEATDDLTIWLNGGPGCSSLIGFFQENGRWTWQPGTLEPIENPYSWVNLTNMLWVEQPVGTGFSIGTPNATSQEETAQDFIKWFKNFEDTFGIQNYKIYISGESYAGRYVPYISAAMLDQEDKRYYNLSGALVYDPCIGEFDYVQEEIPIYPFVEANNNLFNFNASVMSELKGLHESCGYAEYIDKYLKFPATENQPPLYFNSSDPQNMTCDVFNTVNELALRINPCFDVYEINLMCPLLWDVLGFPTALNYAPGSVYFDREDVKKAIHAPENVHWSVCAKEPVFVGGNEGPQGEGDTSLDPIQKVLPQVIEATNRVLVGNGDYDMIIITNGTLLSIQNMTWNGQLGFQSTPTEEIYIDIPDTQWSPIFDANGLQGLPGVQGTMGVQHYERGLMWAETFQAGHMQPQFQPRVAYRHLQWLLGHVDRL